MTFTHHPKLPSARYVLKRVAFHIAWESPEKPDWAVLIKACVVTLVHDERLATMVYGRTIQMFTAVNRELEALLGHSPSNENLCLNILVMS